jgi:hypothetical protein
MASREHWSNDGKLHVKVATIHTDIAGQYVEWGAEAWRDRKHRLTPVWWNPFTWWGYEWRREGSPPSFTDVAFFRSDGMRFADADLTPPPSSSPSQPGYHKYSVIYYYLGVIIQPEDPNLRPGTAPGNDARLGRDARAVARVTVTYTWDGEPHTLSDP